MLTYCIGVSVTTLVSCDGGTLPNDGGALPNDGGALPNDGGALPTRTHYIKASNTNPSDHFGYSVALSADGSTLAVGAPREASASTSGDQTDNSADDAGAVYVFARINARWQQQAYIKPSNPDANDLFGWSVVLSADGNTLAVGAFDEDSVATGVGGDQADNSAPNSGAVYVFARTDGQWSQQAYIKASNTDTQDLFGISVALSGTGDTLVVGASAEDSAAMGVGGDQLDNDSPDSGAVYVYARANGQWSQQAYVKASNTNSDDRFGRSVALSESGDTLAVGAPRESSAATGVDGDQTNNSARDSGAVYVFMRTGVQWQQQSYVKASNTGMDDQFGFSVALSGNGNTLAVGAKGEDNAATGVNGPDGEGLPESGAAYVYTRTGELWSHQAYIKASNSGFQDAFGVSVALSGDADTLVIGAALEASAATGIDGNQANDQMDLAGAAYMFTREDIEWSQQAYIKATNTDFGDLFGGSVALSSAGDTLAIGADQEGSAATGVDGDQADKSAGSAGAVYVFY